MTQSWEQTQAILNELTGAARTEQQNLEREQILQEWSQRPDRWSLPVPETEGDPGAPGSHPSPLGAISWIFPAAGRARVPERFWTLLDRLWGVMQADEWPDRILVDEVTWPPTDPEHRPQVTFGESDLSWGTKLLGMLEQVRQEMDRQPGTPDLEPVDQMIQRLRSQLQNLK